MVDEETQAADLLDKIGYIFSGHLSIRSANFRYLAREDNPWFQEYAARWLDKTFGTQLEFRIFRFSCNGSMKRFSTAAAKYVMSLYLFQMEGIEQDYYRFMRN